MRDHSPARGVRKKMGGARGVRADLRSRELGDRPGTESEPGLLEGARQGASVGEADAAEGLGPGTLDH